MIIIISHIDTLKINCCLLNAKKFLLDNKNKVNIPIQTIEDYYKNKDNELEMHDQLINDIKTDKLKNLIIYVHMNANFFFKNGKDNDIYINELKNLFIVKQVKTILYFTDTHNDTYINEKTLNFFDYLLFPSCTFINLFFSKYLCKIYQFPFSLDETRVHLYSVEFKKRKSKVLLYGSITKEVYPLRTEIYERVKKKKNKYIEILEHCGWRNKRHDIFGEKLLKYLSNYKGAIATSSKYPIMYLVSKYVEILYCGCLGFFEYHPELDILGLKPFVHYIPINSSVEETYYTKNGPKKKIFDINNINEMIEKYLNSDIGEQIAKKGQLHALNVLSNKARFDQFNKIIGIKN